MSYNFANLEIMTFIYFVKCIYGFYSAYAWMPNAVLFIFAIQAYTLCGSLQQMPNGQFSPVHIHPPIHPAQAYNDPVSGSTGHNAEGTLDKVLACHTPHTFALHHMHWEQFRDTDWHSCIFLCCGLKAEYPEGTSKT